MRLVIAGPSGVGKTTLGVELAFRHGLRFVDVDAEIGDPPAVFAAVGEAGFRALERRAMERLAVLDDVVVALGGGGVAVGGALFDAWRRVVLMADAEVLLARLGDATNRPMLSGDRRERVLALLAARRGGWRAFGPWVHTDALDVDTVTRRVEAML